MAHIQSFTTRAAASLDCARGLDVSRGRGVPFLSASGCGSLRPEEMNKHLWADHRRTGT
jgi:hypothetical protein